MTSPERTSARDYQAVWLVCVETSAGPFYLQALQGSYAAMTFDPRECRAQTKSDARRRALDAPMATRASVVAYEDAIARFRRER